MSDCTMRGPRDDAPHLKCLRAILALYVFIWLNVVLPGHTRGAITVAGDAKDTTDKCSSCCSEPTPKTKDGKPTPDQQRRCAICFVAALYTLPVVHRFAFDLLELLQIFQAQAISQLLALDYPTPFWPIGPPCSR